MDPDQAVLLLEEAERATTLLETPVAERLAVLATFDPCRLEHGELATDTLRLLCQTMPSDGEALHSMLAETYRVEVLTRLLRERGPDGPAQVRRPLQADYDTPLQRRLDGFVLGQTMPFDQWNEDELLASLEVWRWATEAVAHAGLSKVMVVQPTRDEIESRLALLGVTRAVRRLAGRGCVGREPELAILHQYLSELPTGMGLAADPAMVVYGVGGVGKSTLVARFVMDLYECRGLVQPWAEPGEPPGWAHEPRPRSSEMWAWAYLDLDRPTLSSCDPDILLDDIAEQVAAQFPDYRRDVQRRQYVARERKRGAGIEAIDSAWSYRDRVGDLASALQSIGTGSLVVVVDTYEELERGGPERGRDLYGLFSALSSAIPRFRLIISGRAPAAEFLDPSRLDRRLLVKPLEGESALTLLRFLIAQAAQRTGYPPPVLDPELGRQILSLVEGIPLTLRLASQVILQEGTAAVLDDVQRARALDRVRSELVRGFLYQRILNHITAPDPRQTSDLRRLARASLALRSITVELIERVLIPALIPSPAGSPADLFGALASEVALVQLDGPMLRLREELRGPALAVLRFEDRELVDRVHAYAIAFYSAAPQTEGNVLELGYHRLAAGHPAIDLDDELLRKLAPSLSELPPSAAELINGALTDPKALSEARELTRWEQQVLAEAEVMLRAGSFEAVHKLLNQRPERTPQTELHKLESRLAEAEGRLDAAIHAGRLEMAAATAAGDPARFAAGVHHVASLCEGQGKPAEADRELARAAAADLLSGSPSLRLELVLNRMNLRERRGLDTEDSRWRLGLDARALIRSSDPIAIATNTALVRLLAAALGGEEPERLTDAVRAVGVGFDEDPVRVRSLANAVAAWDAAQPQPGRLAIMVGLQVESFDPYGLEQAWTAISGLGTQAGYLLDSLFTAEFPPEQVREALRMIYVWWAVEPAAAPAPAPANVVELLQFPLDWSAQAPQRLEEIVSTAYPTSTQLLKLASLAGINTDVISLGTSARRNTRELLQAAARERHMEELLVGVLEDPEAASVYDGVRQLVGSAWLEARGLPG